MVSVTLSIPEEIKKRMDQFSEMNWSGFIRKAILEKTQELTWREDMLKQMAREEEVTRWAVDLQRKARKGRFKELKRKGLV